MWWWWWWWSGGYGKRGSKEWLKMTNTIETDR